jgi:23S rRNA (uracil1939-C5)-methyltransferase
VVVRIDKVVAEGDGLARLADGRVVFVEGGLPGEKVRARIVRQSRDYVRAVAEEILEAHDQRVEPPCIYVRAGCGGCDLQHASLSLQAQIKRDIVAESLLRLGKIPDPEVRWFESRVQNEDLASHDQTGLGAGARRTTLRVVGDMEGRPGFRRRRSHDVVAIEQCLVAHGQINATLASLQLETGREAIVRVGNSSGELVIWTDPSTEIGGVVPSEASSSRAVIHETVAGFNFTVSASSFFQSSPTAAEDLVGAVRQVLGDPSQWPMGLIVDAYGGVGLFSATVIPPERDAVLIEVSESSCGDAVINLANHRVRIVQSPLESWTSEPAAIVIADPPRDGLRAAAVEVIAATGAETVVLVSCDPASLGRDARLLQDAGYRFRTALVTGAFPYTHHVETVSRFDKITDEKF